MTAKISTALLAAFMTVTTSGMARAHEAQPLPYSMAQLAALGWSVTAHLGQIEGEERMLVRDAAGRRRVAILHTDRGLLTFEPLRHPAER